MYKLISQWRISLGAHVFCMLTLPNGFAGGVLLGGGAFLTAGSNPDLLTRISSTASGTRYTSNVQSFYFDALFVSECVKLRQSGGRKLTDRVHCCTNRTAQAVSNELRGKPIEMREGARGIQSIEISGRILKALVRACEPMMLKELAEAAELAPAQCHAYLTSLKHVGLVHQDSDTGYYRMGPFAMRLGIEWLQTAALPSATIWNLKSLTEETGFMSVVVVWGEQGPTIVHINEGISPTALNLRQGTLFSVTGTASGRIFGAFAEPERVNKCIEVNLNENNTARGIGATATRDEFEVQLKLIRKFGYSTAEGAPIPGINAVAAPVFDSQGKLAFAATLIGPINELDVSPGSEAIKRLLALTKQISGADQAASPG